jgi:bisphosphoglycerate-dependent phosphoglycerate mutase
MIHQCTLCTNNTLISSLSFPDQPLSNRFIDKQHTQIPLVDITLASCSQCGVIQLNKLPDIKSVRPIYLWLTYNEPESHLDSVVENLLKLENLPLDSLIVGASYKDGTTLNRLNQKGYANTHLIGYDFLDEPYGLETIQAKLSEPNSLAYSSDVLNRADVFIARHIVEHAHDARQMLSSISSLVKDKGLLILEYPESSTIFSKYNYGFLWEEHISYFTAQDADTIAHSIGAELLAAWRYDYSFEDSMVIVLRINHCPSQSKQASPELAAKHQKTLAQFEAKFTVTKQFWQDKLSKIVNQGHKISVFGAGHLSIKFINFFELTPYISVVIDDNINKADKKMPGSEIPIIQSTAIGTDEYAFCISTLSPESKIKAMKFNGYLKSGISLMDAFTPKVEN